LAKKRTEVLVTIKEWLTIGGGAQDALDDPQLFSAIQAFFESSSEPGTVSEFPPVQHAFETFSEAKRSLQSVFVLQMKRPTIPHGLQAQRSQRVKKSTRAKNVITRLPPDLDCMDPEEFVDNLDGMASAAFSNVTEEVIFSFLYRQHSPYFSSQDLYITADLLEVQSADRTGWFPNREMATNEELVEIQTIYTHILEVERSSMISELSHDSLYRLLPPSVRSCIRAYTLIRKWLISKLVAPRIGLRARQARIELLLQAIELARLRNTETSSSAQQPCVRSFVEAVTMSALLSPECRLHHRVWQSVALSRNCTCDSFSSLLHQPFVQSVSSQESLTVDMGWLLERIIEISATPDILDASSREGQQLINFDKRR